MNEDDDRILVSRCREGDRGACEQLVLRYQKPVFNAALRLLRHPEDAHDVAQTTFLKAFGHLADYDPRFKFYSWIYRIAVNEALNVLGSRKPIGEITGDEPDETPGPERRVEAEQVGEAIEEALMSIKPDLRTVIVLRHSLQLSYEDMSEVLKLPLKTVKSRLYDARQVLRDRLVQRGIMT